MRTLLFDIEGDGLLDTITTIHCIVIRDRYTVLSFHDHKEIPRDGSVADGVKMLGEADLIVGHNIIGFDIPVLKKFFPNFAPKGYHDTYILSQMLYANEMQSHGIEAWGKKFGIVKPPITDYSKFDEELLHRCKEDTAILQRLWMNIKPELDNWDWRKAIDIEYKSYDVFCRNQIHWYVDKEKIERYIFSLEKLTKTCTDKLTLLAPLRIIKNESIVKKYTKTNSHTQSILKFISETGITADMIGDELCKISFETINFNSSKQVIDWLLSIGWVPDKFNYKLNKNGKPVRDEHGQLIVTSPSLRDSKFAGLKGLEGRYLRIRGKAMNRLNTLKGWNNSLFDGNKIPTFAYTCGTNTARWRHVGVVNVPKAEANVFFGKQMRSVFIAKEGYKIVGCDSAQLEARIEGHFTHNYDGGKYADFLLNADIHQFNANSWGLTRSQAKGPGYALAYQCSAKKIEELLKCSAEKAADIHRKYWEDRPAMAMLIEDLEKSVVIRKQATMNKYGAVKLDLKTKPWIKGIDGRKLYVRSAHSLKNTLIQNAGMMTMKVAYIYLDKWIREQNIDARIVIMMHDEFVIMVKDDKAQIEKVKQLAEQSIVKGGEYFKLKVPLAGEAKVGNSWKEVH